MDFFKFDKKLLDVMASCQDNLKSKFKEIDKVCEYNCNKVMRAFIDNKISTAHLNGSTGYGYDDIGRDTIDKLYAQVFDSQDAIVRHNFVSGTHAITVALFGILRPNDSLLSITGSPYDTLLNVIGNTKDSCGSLREFNIHYEQYNIFDNTHSVNELKDKCKRAKVVYIQRSRGYTDRPSLTVKKLKGIIDLVKGFNKNAVVFVDNCYGEFVQKAEPTSIGADLIAGSLIKNPGGGIADTGGYIAGKKNLVEAASFALTAPGIGKETGCSLDQNRKILLGLYFAPTVVSSSLKVCSLASEFFSALGYRVNKDYGQSDIITSITLGDKDSLLAFCEGIQSASPIDSFVSPLPWNMPGYNSQIIMAAGTFTQGASIELSADAPVKSPFNVYLQGGLCYFSSKIALLNAAQNLLNKNLLNIV